MGIILKNEKEIDGIRKSCHLLADLFRFVVPQVKAGMTTKQIDDICVKFIKEHGGKPAWPREGFPGAACISINEELIHGVPSKHRVIEDGDIVSLDIGIDLNGYISDSTHTVMVGNVKPEVRKLVEVTRQCLDAAIQACVAGNRLKDIAKAVYEIAHNQNGYGVVEDYCGHGVGIEVHEDPSVPNSPKSFGANPRIVPGMVLAIEPMINMGTKDVFVDEDDGWTVVTEDELPCSHEEHTVAIFEDHTEVLTACPDLNCWNK